MSFDDQTMVLNSIMTIVFMSICLMLPVLTYGVIRSFKTELRSEHVEDLCGSLYEEINADSKFSLIYPIWFLMRRLLFVMIAVFLADFPGAIHLIYLVLQ